MLRATMLSVALAVASSSCAAVLPMLPKVIHAVSDGIMILDQVEHFIGTYFALHPDKERQAKVGQMLARARAALIAANRAAQGADDLSQQKVDKAFDEFKDAYRELYVMLSGFGLLKPADSDKASVSEDGKLELPDPLVFSLGK